MPNTHLTYCPACGLQGLEYVEKQFHCPACHLELFFNPGTAVCAIILNRQGHLLVVIRAHEPKQGAWDLPGGFVDPGETAEHAVCREVLEELNVALENVAYLCSAANCHYPYKGITYQTTDLAFVGTVETPDRIEAKDDVQDYKWVALEDIDPAKFGFDSIRQIAEHCMTAVSD